MIVKLFIFLFFLLNKPKYSIFVRVKKGCYVMRKVQQYCNNFLKSLYIRPSVHKVHLTAIHMFHAVNS